MSRWSDVINLISITKGLNDNGFPETVESIGELVFANQLPVRSSEFYQASQAGYRITSLYKIHSSDYSGEEVLLHENEKYNIVRTYNTGEFIELSCERRDTNHE